MSSQVELGPHPLFHEITCLGCGCHYYKEGLLGRCPVCPSLETLLGVSKYDTTIHNEQAEQEYWDNKRVGLRSVSNDIVAKILANK